VRIDTGIRQNDEISTFYDPMISKLVVWGETRDQAIANTLQALAHYEILGLKTNIKFCKRVLHNPVFKTGLFDTSFIENNEKQLLGNPPPSELHTLRENLSVLLMHVWHENQKLRSSRRSSLDPWLSSDNFRVNHRQLREIALLPHEEAKEETLCLVEYLSENSFDIKIGSIQLKNVQFFQNPENPKEFIVKLEQNQFKVPFLLADGKPVVLSPEGVPVRTTLKKEYSANQEGITNMDSFIKSPIPGTVVKVYCQPGQEVKKD
jgi:3-methylcrotonyl-CoA carboxylase alpha subunit